MAEVSPPSSRRTGRRPPGTEVLLAQRRLRLAHCCCGMRSLPGGGQLRQAPSGNSKALAGAPPGQGQACPPERTLQRRLRCCGCFSGHFQEVSAKTTHTQPRCLPLNTVTHGSLRLVRTLRVEAETSEGGSQDQSGHGSGQFVRYRDTAFHAKF